jgi:peptide/nickel transport system substrate-binding protein
MIARARAIANGLCWLVLAGCAGTTRTPDTIVIASGTDLDGMQPLTSVHPLSRQVQRYLVFTPLARLSSSLTPEPWAARSWSWDVSRTTLAMVVDTSLRWHDGTQVSAADAAFTLQLARDSVVGYARRADLVELLAVETAGADTLRLVFRRPQAELPMVLTELPLVPKHLLDSVPPSRIKGHPFQTSPVGSGPYRLVTRESGRRWVFERIARFPARMGGRAATRFLVVAVVDEATTKVAGLISGALDLAGVNPATATLVRRDPALRVIDYPTFFTNWLTFNPTCDRVRDVRVRRAIASSIDRGRIVAAGVGGYGVPSAAWTADLAQDTTAADSTFADSLFNAAGWTRSRKEVRQRDGQPLELEMLTVGTGDNPVEQLLQADLRAQGVTLRILTRDMGALLTAARGGTGTHCLVYSGVVGDATRGQIAALFDPRSAGGALDLGAARPRNMTAAFASFRAAATPAARDSAWQVVERLLNDSLPAVAVFHSRGVQGATRRLQNVTIDLRGELFSAPQWLLSPRGASR